MRELPLKMTISVDVEPVEGPLYQSAVKLTLLEPLP
jgi:hypothetical protein